MSNKKLFIFDLDGSLLKDDGSISSYTKQTITCLRKSPQNIVCLLTGRPTRMAMSTYRLLKLDAPMFTYNGSHIFYKKNNIKNKQIIDYQAIVNYLHHSKLVDNFIIDLFKKEYVKKEFTTYKSLLLKYGFLIPNAITVKENKIQDFKKANLGWILVFVKKQSITSLTKSLKKIANNKFVYRKWFFPKIGSILEINLAHSTKQKALQQILKIYKCTFNDCYVFADHENDIPLFKLCKNTFAMRNASSKLKVVAKHITKFTNNQDGIAHELIKFL